MAQISDATIDAFMKAPDEKKKSALSQMSLETKQALLSELKVRKARPAGLPEGVSLPGIPAAPNPIASASEHSAASAVVRAGHEAKGFVKEAGKKAGELGEGLLNLAADAGGADLPISTAPIAATKEQREERNEAKRQTNEAVDYAKENPGETVKNAAEAAGGMAKDAVVSPFHAARGKEGNYDPAWASRAEMFASSILGGDTESARENFAKGEYGKGQADLLTTPALTAAGGEAMGKLGGKEAVSAASTGKTATKELERLASIQAPTGASVETYDVAREVQPLLKQWLSEKGTTEADIHPTEAPLYGTSKGKFPSRAGRVVENEKLDVHGNPTKAYVSNLRQGARDVLEAANGAVDVADRPFTKIVGEYGNESPITYNENGKAIPGTVQKRVADELEQQAKLYDNPEDKAISSAIRTQAREVMEAKNLGDLQRIKARANKGIASLLKGNPSQQAAAGYSNAMAWKMTGDAIRQHMYPELQRLSGVDLKPFGMRESAAMRFRDGVYSNYFQTIDRSQASEAAKGFLGGLKHDMARHSGYKARLMGLKKSPAGEFNEAFRKGVGHLGEGGTPENIRIEGKPQLALPAPADMQPNTFRISTGLPEEVMSKVNSEGSKIVTPAERTFAGTKEVPNPDHTPLTGPSWRRQRQQLGSTADTIPDRVRGERSPAQIRKDEAPTSAPDRAFTGEPTKVETQWVETPETVQHIPPAVGSGGEVTRAGGGYMETTSPELALKTRNRLKDFMQTKEFDKLPQEQRTAVRAEFSSLDSQIKDHMAYRNAKAPRRAIATPYDPGTITKRNRMRNYAAARAAAATNQ